MVMMIFFVKDCEYRRQGRRPLPYPNYFRFICIGRAMRLLLCEVSEGFLRYVARAARAVCIFQDGAAGGRCPKPDT